MQENLLENHIRGILENQCLPSSVKVMQSVLALHRDLYREKYLATKFSRPLQADFAPAFTELNVFNHYGLRKMPLRAQNALVQWAYGNYPIELLHFTPTPWQILEMQAIGHRCVSMNLQSGFLQQIYEGKNYFDFIIHDLVHADHFFHNEENCKGQIGFARFLLKWKSESHLFFLDEERFQAEFQNEFDYLISDMNSHPLHLMLTLKSILDRYFRDAALSDRWIQTVFVQFPDLAKNLIAKNREQAAHGIEYLFANKATENFSLNFG